MCVCICVCVCMYVHVHIYPSVWRESSIRLSWLVCMSHVTHANTCHMIRFTCATWLTTSANLVTDPPHVTICTCVTWPIHMCGVTRFSYATWLTTPVNLVTDPPHVTHGTATLLLALRYAKKVKRDTYIWKEPYQRDPHYSLSNPWLARYIKRDPCIRKETHKAETSPRVRTKDMRNKSKETYIYGKNPIKEAYFLACVPEVRGTRQKRPIHMGRTLQKRPTDLYKRNEAYKIKPSHSNIWNELYKRTQHTLCWVRSIHMEKRTQHIVLYIWNEPYTRDLLTHIYKKNEENPTKETYWLR